MCIRGLRDGTSFIYLHNAEDKRKKNANFYRMFTSERFVVRASLPEAELFKI